MKELNVTITMDEEGTFKVQTTEGMPIFTAIGMIETAKFTLMRGGERPVGEDNSQDDPELQDMQEGNEEGE